MTETEDRSLPSQPCLDRDALGCRLEEEVGRAARMGTSLTCLLLRIEDLAGTIRPRDLRERGAAGERGEGEEDLDSRMLDELSDRTLDLFSRALRPQLRTYDRVGRPRPGELLVVLPGADIARGECVARRSLERLRAIKLEVEGERHELRISVGIAAWRLGLTAAQLLLCARAAARRAGDEGGLGQSLAESSAPHTPLQSAGNGRRRAAWRHETPAGASRSAYRDGWGQGSHDAAAGGSRNGVVATQLPAGPAS